jgi:hypothetical protein
MGDFFLVQMDDFFTEGVCFDNRKEGEGGAPGGRSPIILCEGQSEGPEPSRLESSDPMREAGGSSTEVVELVLEIVRAPPG